MLEFGADYYDGKSSRRTPVTVRVADGVAAVQGEGVSRELPVARVQIKPRIGGTPQRLELPDGALLTTSAHDTVAAAFGIRLTTTLAHRLESNLPFVFASLLMLVAIFWLGYRYGLPWAAKEIAMQFPSSIEATLGEEALQSLDTFATEKSQLELDQRKSLTDRFAQLRKTAGLPDGVRLEFRDGGFIGPNALALPGGVVVVTDQLVNIMAADEQVVAVLAHELGHVEQRHSMRVLLQSSVTALVTMAVFGDASAIAGLAATIPTALAHSGFSRDFEREADQFAFDLLRKSGQRPADLGAALARLQAAHQRDSDEDKSYQEQRAKEGKRPARNTRRRGVDMGYFSTHPATDERIRAANEAPQ